MGDWVFKEGQVSDTVYVVKSGEFIVCKNLYSQKNNDKEILLQSNGLLLTKKK